MRNFLIVGLALFGAFNLMAEPATLPKTIRMAAPGDGSNFEWPVITEDRQGLYSKIYDAVFEAAGMQVIQDSEPNSRAMEMVKNGTADFYPGEIKGKEIGDYTFFTPRYAIWFTSGEALLYKRKTIPVWHGVESLKGRLLVSQRGTSHLSALDRYKAILGPTLDQALLNPTTEGALRMVVTDRADVLVASVELIRAAQTQIGLELTEDTYHTEFLDRNKFYPLFQNSERGRQLAEIFDRGMATLARRGLLTQWFGHAGTTAAVENIDPDLLSLR